MAAALLGAMKMAGEARQGRELATPLWVLVLSLVLGVALAGRIAGSATNFEDLALGDQTASVFGSVNGDKVFCGSIAEAPECLGPARQRNLAKRVVWLGNSQLHSINQPKPADRTAPVLLAEWRRAEGTEVIGFSMPNASLTELLVVAAYLDSDRPIDVLIVPLFLDDMREQKVREALRPAVEAPELKARLQQFGAGRYAIDLLAKAAVADAPAETHALSLQQKSENFLTDRLERCCDVQTTRNLARGEIEVQAFMFRNWAFNITAQSVRPIIPTTYAQNMAALEDIFRLARARSTRVIAYIPPLRQDFKPPYDPQQYAQFKAQTRTLAGRYGVRWVDLDRLVPGRYWGTKAATRTGGAPELDFMHYQGPGHLLLAEAMQPLVSEALK